MKQSGLGIGVTALLVAGVVFASPAFAATVDVGGARVSWDDATMFAQGEHGCSTIRFNYANGTGRELLNLKFTVESQFNERIAGDSYVAIMPGVTGVASEQVCDLPTGGDPYRVVVSVADYGGGSQESSAPITFRPRPDYVRCVNKRTYQVQDVQGKRCAAGWVKR